MNRTELLKNHQELCRKAYEIMQRKNHDYAGRGGESPFANFTRCESMGICTTEQGFLVRLTDKMSRLSSFVESGVLQVKDESVEDTILDVINYAVLFRSYLQQKETANEASDQRDRDRRPLDLHPDRNADSDRARECVAIRNGIVSSRRD